MTLSMQPAVTGWEPGLSRFNTHCSYCASMRASDEGGYRPEPCREGLGPAGLPHQPWLGVVSRAKPPTNK